MLSRNMRAIADSLERRIAQDGDLYFDGQQSDLLVATIRQWVLQAEGLEEAFQPAPVADPLPQGVVDFAAARARRGQMRALTAALGEGGAA